MVGEQIPIWRSSLLLLSAALPLACVVLGSVGILRPKHTSWSDGNWHIPHSSVMIFIFWLSRVMMMPKEIGSSMHIMILLLDFVQTSGHIMFHLSITPLIFGDHVFDFVAIVGIFWYPAILALTGQYGKPEMKAYYYQMLGGLCIFQTLGAFYVPHHVRTGYAGFVQSFWASVLTWLRGAPIHETLANVFLSVSASIAIFVNFDHFSYDLGLLLLNHWQIYTWKAIDVFGKTKKS